MKRLHVFASCAVLCAAFGVAGCQDIEFVFQPDTDREGAHIRFTVQTPSKADMLFVVDNSGSMRDEQIALKQSIGQMLDFLAPRDTSYRIGIISTDAQGSQRDCCNNPIPPAGPDNVTAGGKGNCQSCGCVDINDPMAPQTCSACMMCNPSVVLRRPHDGSRGRLIAAYDPAVFDVDAVDESGNPLYVDAAGQPLSPQLKSVLASAFPTGASMGPGGYAGAQGVRWVIDREAIREDACNACNCTPCDPNDPAVQTCFDGCANPISRALVTAYFNSNINGLGIEGFGWEEGLKNAMYAVGIDPRLSDQAQALDPAFNLTAPGEANSYTTLDDTGRQVNDSWLRDDALLAMMFVSDEEDCSAQDYLIGLRKTFEQDAIPPQPGGSMCYQALVANQFLKTARNEGGPSVLPNGLGAGLAMSELLIDKKGGRPSGLSRVAIGFVGGTRKAGPPGGAERRQGDAVDCVASSVPQSVEPSNACSCLTGAPMADAMAWCNFTNDSSGMGPTCDALAGARYVDFASAFRRKTFDSICREGSEVDANGQTVFAFGPALEDFAQIATLACFELGDKARPAVDPVTLQPDPTNIEVKRAPRDQADAGEEPTLLPMLDPNALLVPEGGAWVYDPNENKICLEGLDRLIGDVYDIFVLHQNCIEFDQDGCETVGP